MKMKTKAKTILALTAIATTYPSLLQAEDYSNNHTLKSIYLNISILGKEVRKESGVGYLMPDYVVETCKANPRTVASRGMNPATDGILGHKVHNRECHVAKHFIGKKSDGNFPIMSTPSIAYHNLNLGMLSTFLSTPKHFSTCYVKGRILIHNDPIMRTLVLNPKRANTPLLSGYHQKRNPCNNKEMNPDTARGKVYNLVPKALKSYKLEKVSNGKVVATAATLGTGAATVTVSGRVAIGFLSMLF